MEINVLYAFFISLFGFPVGIIVSMIAKEELKQGIKYFKMLSIVLLIGVIGSLIYALINNDFLLLFSFVFLLGIPVGSLIAIKYRRILRLRIR